MKIRNFLLGCSMALAAVPSLAADYPEAMYLVGSINEWTLPAYGNQIEIPAVGDGIYSATLDLSSSYGNIDFKVFNTAADSWEDASEYYGAEYAYSSSNIFSDAPASWTLAPGYGSGNFSIINTGYLPEAVVTISLIDNKITVASASAPAAPQEIYITCGGEDGVKYSLERDAETPVFKGSLTLEAGVQDLLITGNNDYQLGTDGTPNYYLWKDCPEEVMMVTGSSWPLTVTNFVGGRIDVSLNISTNWVTFNAPEQPSFPDSIYMVMNGGSDMEEVYPIRAREFENGYMVFLDTIQISRKPLRFKLEVPGAGTLYTDFEPKELWKDYNIHFRLSPDYENEIEVSNWAGGELCVFVSPDFSSISLLSPTQPVPMDHLYLIGTPQGWNLFDDSMELTKVDEGVFYGEFDFPADPIFRFYSLLENWDYASFGSQVTDNPIEYIFEGRELLNVDMVLGKGSWRFVDFPGGMMYMIVNIPEMHAKFSAYPIFSEIDVIGSDEVKFNVIDGGVEVTAPQDIETVVYDLVGRIAGIGKGSCRIPLRTGVYIVNNEKIVVR